MNGSDTSRRQIVILGGGTAGWIAANAMAHRWASQPMRITLIESPAIGTVGVGEGSTPRLKAFFDGIGIDESEWMPACNATYKNGISFCDWSRRPGFERYFHPFASQLDQHTTQAFFHNTRARRQGADVHAHPDRFFLSARLTEEKLGPLPNRNFPFVVEYGYHFDAHLVGEFLKSKAVERGVRHVSAVVADVRRSPEGDIAALTTDEGEEYSADFFVDCSGFRAALIQQTLGVEFRPYAENLFNDAAVVVPTPQVANIDVQTVSTALKHGWAWRIPLTNRIGNGYVYASSFCSADEAETELRRHLALADADVEARHLKMRVGRVAEHWHRNCLAVGLSQGFIEPLEATALNLVCNTVDDFIDTVDPNTFGADGRDSYNRRCNERFETVRDYIVAHYILNTRDDTDYWRQNAANRNVPETLQQILEIWKSGESLTREMARRELKSSYTPMSWYCLLSGYGFFPPVRAGAEDTRIDMAAIDDFVQRSALNFRPHRDLLRQD